jgi:hypothetical protein
MEKTTATSRPAKALEFEPDAWERFERAVGIVARAPPQHRPNKRLIHRARRNNQTQIMLNGAELAAVDDFRFKQQMPTRAAAVRELLKRGLAAKDF